MFRSGQNLTSGVFCQPSVGRFVDIQPSRMAPTQWGNGSNVRPGIRLTLSQCKPFAQNVLVWHRHCRIEVCSSRSEVAQRRALACRHSVPSASSAMPGTAMPGAVVPGPAVQGQRCRAQRCRAQRCRACIFCSMRVQMHSPDLDRLGWPGCGLCQCTASVLLLREAGLGVCGIPGVRFDCTGLRGVC